jgi:DNA-binding transcriptional MerR regulator
MDQRTVVVLLSAIQSSVAQLDKEQGFYEELLCNCNKNNEHQEILSEKLSKVKTQIEDLDKAFDILSKVIKQGIVIKSNNLEYEPNFQFGELTHIKIT